MSPVTTWREDWSGVIDFSATAWPNIPYGVTFVGTGGVGPSP